MDYQLLPSTDDPYLVFYMPASPDGHAFQAQVELRFLPAPEKWFLSISDGITGEVYVNQIPVLCSYEILNDLLYPFRWLFQGSGIGSFFCVKGTDQPSSPDPGRHNLKEFILLWGDQWKEALRET